MWGLHRPAREQVEKLKVDVVRACQCMVALRLECADVVGSGDGSLKMRYAISAGAVSALWIGGHGGRRQFMLKGTPMVLLRKATAEADWGQIVLTSDAHRLGAAGVDADFDSAIQGAVLKDIVRKTEDGNATPVIPLEPLNTVTENLAMTKDICAKRELREKLLEDLYKIEREDTGFEEEDPNSTTGEMHRVFTDKLDVLGDTVAVRKKIDKFRSLTKEAFLEDRVPQESTPR
jgi:hypothetical protein